MAKKIKSKDNLFRIVGPQIQKAEIISAKRYSY
jgi:hypothetical protein